MEEWRWEKLLADIEGGQVIPVVGPELVTVKVDGVEIPLYRHLASEIIKRLEMGAEDLPEGYDFFSVISEFLLQQPTHVRRYEADQIYYTIRDIMTEHEWETPERLQKLASIRHFNLFVSTSFDLLLEQAVNEQRAGGAPWARSLAYCTKDRPEDLPDDIGKDGVATIYHVFGKLNAMNDFAVTDEDTLHYAHKLQLLDFRPNKLFDEIRSKRLLTLGCSFPGWLTRFFLAAAKGEDLFSSGVPGFLADDRSSKDRSLVGFLERKKTSVYTQGDALSFVDELHQRWVAKFGGTVEVEEPMVGESKVSKMPPESVFISFRREDRDVARDVAKRFRGEGVDVWFDETDLEPGDRYKEKIKNHIFNCFAFVPLVSRHSVMLEAKPWFYRFEWKLAVEASDYRGHEEAFVLPILVDDTDPQNHGIPPSFREAQATRLKNLDRLIQGLRERIRNHRRERRTT